MKRFIDIIFSLVLLIILSPLFLIIFIATKFDSRGPIFFRQRRIGKDNKEFMIYKFRTMRVGTPNVATDKLANPEQYITGIGKFLRKTSLDELPQLINILKGEMTFVGPRPALYNQYELIEMRTSAGVHALVPGVTGWAQINGRDSLNDSAKVMNDKYYLENLSAKLDFKILIMTILKVLKADGIIEGGSNKNSELQNKESF